MKTNFIQIKQCFPKKYKEVLRLICKLPTNSYHNSWFLVRGVTTKYQPTYQIRTKLEFIKHPYTLHKPRKSSVPLYPNTSYNHLHLRLQSPVKANLGFELWAIIP